MIDTKRASALRDALCQILSATGAYSHEIPSLCQKALERDNAMLDEASSTPRVPLSEEGKVIGSAPDRASLRSSVEALIAQWRYVANYLAVTTTMDIGATNAQIRTLQHCADQLEALLRSSVRDDDLARIGQPVKASTLQHASTDTKGE
jgi:hypothetical protein